MLSDRHTKLVIDYVDGTLSPRQRKTVLQLLHKSPKAQRLLEQLQANVELLRSLPKHSIDPQFVTTLLEEIKSRGLERISGPIPVVQPAPPPIPTPPVPTTPFAAPRPVAPRRAFPARAGIAVAAAVLAMVSFGSYLFFANLGNDQPDNNTPVVQTPTPKIVPEPMLPDPLVNGLIAGANDGYNRPIGLQIAAADLSR